jgi:hypothetical protein
MSCGLGPHLLAEVSSGPATCPSALNLTSLHGWPWSGLASSVGPAMGQGLRPSLAKAPSHGGRGLPWQRQPPCSNTAGDER